MPDEISDDITWTPLLESFIRSIGEKSYALSWLHNNAEQIYSHRKTYVELPAIVCSAVLAFLNAASTNIFGDPRISSVALGVGSLVVSLMQSVNAYFSWARLAEGHRIGALHYSKVYRWVQIQMGLPREERMPAAQLLRTLTEQYNRLAETSPTLPSESISAFRSRFGDKKYESIARPEGTNGLEKIIVFREELSSELQSNPFRVRTPRSAADRETQRKTESLSPGPPPAPGPADTVAIRVPETTQSTAEAEESSTVQSSQSNFEASESPRYPEQA